MSPLQRQDAFEKIGDFLASFARQRQKRFHPGAAGIHHVLVARHQDLVLADQVRLQRRDPVSPGGVEAHEIPQRQVGRSAGAEMRIGRQEPRGIRHCRSRRSPVLHAHRSR
ncbi:hypothetical protein [Paracoccus marinus]|uniref:hypothetical protein n=1 Tax=Paracoccus marinus TaxID=288426 RepID=UPI001C8F5337|nr:hypothetical protein [Paracoccus marinus]